MDDKAFLFSIRPEYANKILDGSKTIELRRILPNIKKGDMVFVYATAPVKALIGVFKVGKIVSAQPQNLWDKVCSKAGITYENYAAYFAGATTAHGIFVSDVRSLAEPIGLDQLKEIWPDFHPPQSYRYINGLQNNSFFSCVNEQL